MCVNWPSGSKNLRIHLCSANELLPNNWFLSRRKVDSVRRAWQEDRQGYLPPILISRIDDTLSLIDGHSRAFVALERHSPVVPAVYKKLTEIEGPQRVYEKLAREGRHHGVSNLKDLSGRILPDSEYERIWLQYCADLEKEL
jgi:hypothetical protein